MTRSGSLSRLIAKRHTGTAASGGSVGGCPLRPGGAVGLELGGRTGGEIAEPFAVVGLMPPHVLAGLPVATSSR